MLLLSVDLCVITHSYTIITIVSSYVCSLPLDQFTALIPNNYVNLLFIMVVYTSPDFKASNEALWQDLHISILIVLESPL